MKSFRPLSFFFILTLVAATRVLAAASGTLTPVDAKTDPKWLTAAQAAYPLDRCVVSDDKFDGGEMGKPQDFVYRVEGQPDRLVRLCCKSCLKDFKKDPTAFLKTLDAAAGKKSPAGK